MCTLVSISRQKRHALVAITVELWGGCDVTLLEASALVAFKTKHEFHTREALHKTTNVIT